MYYIEVQYINIFQYSNDVCPLEVIKAKGYFIKASNPKSIQV